MATLARLGYLNQDESTRKYRLGIRALDLGFAVLGSLELRDIAAPHLQRLTAATGHTSNLAIRDDTDVILIDRNRGRPGRYHHLEFTLHVGSRIPSYCSATGKALHRLPATARPSTSCLTASSSRAASRSVGSRAALMAELGRGAPHR